MASTPDSGHAGACGKPPNGESTGKTEAESKPAPGRAASGAETRPAPERPRLYDGAMTANSPAQPGHSGVGSPSDQGSPRDRRVSQRIGSIAESATLKVDAK